MRIGILGTGRVHPSLTEAHGEYPEMFADWIQSADPSVELRTYPVVDNVLPDAVDACDAWLITGSKYGVYDDEPWIAPLKDFLRRARAARVPMIGICFGHQLMAEAFGGRAEMSDKGWGCGPHDYDMVARPGWLAEAGDGFTMHAMHQDQVTAIPADATVLARSEFCEFAMLSYGDPEAPDAISVQPHPEFGTDYARDLVALRAGTLIPPAVSDPALASFGQPVARESFAAWCLAYLRHVLKGRAAA